MSRVYALVFVQSFAIVWLLMQSCDHPMESSSRVDVTVEGEKPLPLAVHTMNDDGQLHQHHVQERQLRRAASPTPTSVDREVDKHDVIADKSVRVVRSL
jgi:hypothetical protein